MDRLGALLRIEAAAELALVLFLYVHLHGNWLVFVVLFLVPDLGIIGYTLGPRVGAGTYNALHTMIVVAGSRGSSRAQQPRGVPGAHLVRAYRARPAAGVRAEVSNAVPGHASPAGVTDDGDAEQAVATLRGPAAVKRTAQQTDFAPRKSRGPGTDIIGTSPRREVARIGRSSATSVCIIWRAGGSPAPSRRRVSCPFPGSKRY